MTTNATPDRCPSRSPESSSQCLLPDNRMTHKAGHRGQVDDVVSVGWPTSVEDSARWGELSVRGADLMHGDHRIGAPPTPERITMALDMAELFGPEVATGDRVRVLSRAGESTAGVGELGDVMAPGYDLSRLPGAEPAMRVIAVRLDNGGVIDVTGWELA